MQTELYKCIKSINIKNLNDDDNEDLLRLFMVTKNSLIRDRIAFIFEDIHYNKAVPYVMKKIKDKSNVNNNSSLLLSLTVFDLKKYFVDLINIICEHGYETRLIAYGIIKELVPDVPTGTRLKSLKILEMNQLKLEQTAVDKGENSTLHFVEETKRLLSPANDSQRRLA